MNDRPLYRVRVGRDGPGWLVTVEGVPGAHAQAGTFDAWESAAREVVALILEVEPDTFDVEIDRPAARPLRPGE